MSLSMSRAGTPTDNGYAERFVGVFKLAGASRRPYHNLGEFLQAAKAWINFYYLERPHEGLDNLSPLPYVRASWAKGYAFTHPIVISLLARTGQATCGWQNLPSQHSFFDSYATL